MIDDEGHARLCDFGLVRLITEHGHTGLTTTSAFSGTVRYLSNELCIASDDRVPTTASDIHAVGCVGLEVRRLEKTVHKTLKFSSYYSVYSLMENIPTTLLAKSQWIFVKENLPHNHRPAYRLTKWHGGPPLNTAGPLTLMIVLLRLNC